MHYNIKVEMERIRDTVVTQIELASFGRASRRRIVTPDFDSAMVELQKAHDEMLASAEAFHNPGAKKGADADAAAIAAAKKAEEKAARAAAAAAKKSAAAKGGSKKGAAKAQKKSAVRKVLDKITG